MRLLPRDLFCLSLIVGLFLAGVAYDGLAQSLTPSAAPMIAGCPSPIPTGQTNWPQPTCKYIFYPLTDATHAIASLSKTTPTYQHTYPAYLATQLLVACPAGASVLGAICNDSTGKDASVVIAKSAIPALTIVPVTPPGPDYTTITSYTIEQSYDAGKTWDTASTTITYDPQAAAHCFRITPHRKDGDGPALVSCPLPK